MSLVRPLFTRRGSQKMVASVLFERLPVVIPKIDPIVYAFQLILSSALISNK
ncbi:hypothetical protein MtrunA17_Chr7g0275741 [Medicago truncatula]|uniref:Uncharacterized protein n=1 Tax=Medicago truncatula TaxID=3880 RepID=A0A396HCN9_MEDTR|nr:hypothetical protein MtrunA17_Chr7g0275741 [Medicago truncatula]